MEILKTRTRREFIIQPNQWIQFGKPINFISSYTWERIINQESDNPGRLESHALQLNIAHLIGLETCEVTLIPLSLSETTFLIVDGTIKMNPKTRKSGRKIK